MHAQLPCTGRPFGGDAHLRHGHAVEGSFAGEEPGRQPSRVLGLRSDHHVLVLGGLHELIERGAESPGDGDQLIECDPAVPGLDAAQGGGAEVAAGGEGVQRPAASQSQAADALGGSRCPGRVVVAIDTSALMLGRLRAAALEQGLADRLRVVQADLDLALPAVGAVDVAWALSSLHHVADPDRVLRDIHTALNPGGLPVVIEMDALPRFLPDDVGMGRSGLEARCHEAAAEANWNSHPDWRPHLERAGFEIAEQRLFTIEASPASPSAGHYAHAYLRRIRSALDGQLSTDDRNTLDHLLADGRHDALLRHRDLTVRGSRTAWAARRRP